MKLSIGLSLAILTAFVAAGPASAQQGQILPVVSENAMMEDKLGEFADLDRKFVNSDGRTVTLRELVSGERPIVLNLGFYSCPLACGPISNNIVDALQNAEMMPGERVDILSVSIDETETADLAKRKKASYMKKLGMPGAEQHWHFLTGDSDAINAVCRSVGYRFERQEHTDIIDHPPTLVLLTKDGRVSRYLNGLVMTPVTFDTAVVEAGEGTVGSFLERLFVSCLTYDPSSGTYSVAAMTIMQIGGALTVIALATMIIVLLRRERAKNLAVAT